MTRVVYGTGPGFLSALMTAPAQMVDNVVSLEVG